MYRADYTRPAAHRQAGRPATRRRDQRTVRADPWDFKRRLLLKKSPTTGTAANVKSDTIEMVVSENVLNQFLLLRGGVGGLGGRGARRPGRRS